MGDGLVVVCHNVLAALIEIASGFGKRHAGIASVKELEAQFIFIFLDLQAHGSLGYELFIGSLCKVQIFGGGKKKWEPFDAHMNTSYRGKDVWHPSFFYSTIN